MKELLGEEEQDKLWVFDTYNYLHIYALTQEDAEKQVSEIETETGLDFVLADGWEKYQEEHAALVKKENERMNPLRHFSELTNEELLLMYNEAINAMLDYSNKIGMGGLAHLSSHDLYKAIEQAIKNEHVKAQAAQKRNNSESENKP